MRQNSHNRIDLRISECSKYEGNSSAKGAATFIYSGNKKQKLVIKIPRDPEFCDHIIREGENLINLHTNYSNKSGILKSIPRFIEYQYFGSSQALIICALEGKLMARWITKQNYVDALIKAADWLAEFHVLTKRNSLFQLSSESVDFLFGKDPDLSAYGEVDGTNVWIIKERYDSIQKSIKQQLLKFDGVTIPLSMVHGDFNPNNILIKNNRIAGVFDWGESNQHSLSFEDLFHFPLSMFLSKKFRISTARTNNPGELWDQVCTYNQDIKKYIIHYSNQIGINPGLPYAFIPWYFFITAKKELLQWRHDLKSFNYYLGLAEIALEKPLEKDVI